MEFFQKPDERVLRVESGSVKWIKRNTRSRYHLKQIGYFNGFYARRDLKLPCASFFNGMKYGLIDEFVWLCE